MSPLKLSNDELDAVMQAARPLPIDMRDPFLQAVAHALSGHDVIGPGVVHQVRQRAAAAIFKSSQSSRTGKPASGAQSPHRGTPAPLPPARRRRRCAGTGARRCRPSSESRHGRAAPAPP